MNTSVPVQVEAVGALRAKTLQAMQDALHEHIVVSAQQCAERLLAIFPHKALNNNRVFVAYGGGKDSSYVVAFVRLLQLLLFDTYGTTFKLVIATNRHSGMPYAVLQNIDGVYRAISAYADPDVELLLVDGDDVSPFTTHSPFTSALVERNRMDILMTGHRCGGDARPTFCNACNLSMIKSFGVVAAYGEGVDVVITGDSSREQRAYLAWIRQISRKFGLPPVRGNANFGSFLNTISDITHYYFQDIYGDHAESALEKRQIGANSLPRPPLFFSIYQDTAYEAGEHWTFLTDFLGFRFDDLAFSFTETDCVYPALMAHLRGLRTEHLYGRTYEDGIREYMQFAIELMHKKSFPFYLIEIMKERYSTPAGIQAMRQRLNEYAETVLHVTQEQLVSMLYAPFVQRGQNLQQYIDREQPDLSEQLSELHTLLARHGEAVDTEAEHQLARRLTTVSGLDISYLRSLYRMEFSQRGGKRWDNPIAVILNGDPHKSMIETVQKPGGPVVMELISGR